MTFPEPNGKQSSDPVPDTSAAAGDADADGGVCGDGSDADAGARCWYCFSHFCKHRACFRRQRPRPAFPAQYPLFFPRFAANARKENGTHTGEPNSTGAQSTHLSLQRFIAVRDDCCRFSATNGGCPFFPEHFKFAGKKANTAVREDEISMHSSLIFLTHLRSAAARSLARSGCRSAFPTAPLLVCPCAVAPAVAPLTGFSRFSHPQACVGARAHGDSNQDFRGTGYSRHTFSPAFPPSISLSSTPSRSRALKTPQVAHVNSATDL